MITLEIIQRIWSLIPPPAPDGSIEVRELDISADGTANPRLTIDHQGHRHLLIPAPSSTRLIEDRRSSGVHLLSAEWGDEDIHRRFVDVVCLKPHLNGLFDLIIYEVLAEIDQSAAQADRVCLAVLNRWRELLAQDTLQIPQRSEIIGLFGELSVLRRFAQVNPNSLPAWTGPDGGRFDFFADSYAVEVKTTLRRQGIQLTIHGHDQLDPPADVKLYIGVLLIEETPAAGENLSMQVEALIASGVNRAELYRKLARIGFTPDVLEVLSNQRFTVNEFRLYAVRDDFPSITTRSFVGGRLPRGVTALNYTIDLSVPPPHPLNEADTLATIAALAESVS
jgi:hypothetical protein